MIKQFLPGVGRSISVLLVVVLSVAGVPVGEFAPAYADNSASPHRYTGQRYDTGTGLYYYQSRYYDPQLGRFISPDAIVQAPADPQSLNRYTYVRNNPVVHTDPSGHFFGLIAAIVVAVISSVAWDYGVRLVKQQFNPSDAWDEYTRDLKKTWDAVRAPMISGASAWALTGLMFGFGKAAMVAGASAAATTAVLQTGEGRQFLRRAGNEFFDDVLGLRPKAAYRAAALTTHMVLNAGFQLIGGRLVATQTVDQTRDYQPATDQAEATEILEPGGGGGVNFGPRPKITTEGALEGVDLMLLSEGQPVGVAARALGNEHLGVIMKGLTETRDLASFFQHPVTAIRQGYLSAGISHTAVNHDLLNAGFHSTVGQIGAGWTTALSTVVYGPYGGGLSSAVAADQMR